MSFVVDAIGSALGMDKTGFFVPQTEDQLRRFMYVSSRDNMPSLLGDVYYDNGNWFGTNVQPYDTWNLRIMKFNTAPVDFKVTDNGSERTVSGLAVGKNMKGETIYLDVTGYQNASGRVQYLDRTNTDNAEKFFTQNSLYGTGSSSQQGSSGQQGSTGQQNTPQQGTPNTGATFEDTGADRNNALISQMTQGNKNILAGGANDMPTTSAGVLEGLLTAGQRMAGGSRGRLFNI